MARKNRSKASVALLLPIRLFSRVVTASGSLSLRYRATWGPRVRGALGRSSGTRDLVGVPVTRTTTSVRAVVPGPIEMRVEESLWRTNTAQIRVAGILVDGPAKQTIVPCRDQRPRLVNPHRKIARRDGQTDQAFFVRQI